MGIVWHYRNHVDTQKKGATVPYGIHEQFYTKHGGLGLSLDHTKKHESDAKF